MKGADGGPAAFSLRATLAATMSPAWGVYAGYELYENEALAFFRDVVEPYVRTRPFVRWLVRYVDGIPDDPKRAAETNIVFEVRPQTRG